MRAIKYILGLMFLIGVLGCYIFTPNVPLGGNLELTSDYYHYVWLLNRATHKNKLALKRFLSIDKDAGAAEDHGAVIIELIKLQGDDFFSETLKEIDSKRIQQLNSYIGSATQFNRGSFNDSLFKQHPKTFKALKYTSEEMREDSANTGY